MKILFLEPMQSSCTGDCNQERSCTCAPCGDDGLGAARGIVNGILMSIPVWGLFALAWWLS